jgi:hypothetical protein
MKIKPKSLSDRAANIKLDQNKTSVQKNCTGLEKIKILGWWDRCLQKIIRFLGPFTFTNMKQLSETTVCNMSESTQPPVPKAQLTFLSLPQEVLHRILLQLLCASRCTLRRLGNQQLCQTVVSFDRKLLQHYPAPNGQKE